MLWSRASLAAFKSSIWLKIAARAVEIVGSFS